jgi:hypothetical protein
LEQFLSNLRAPQDKPPETALALNQGESEIATWRDPDWQRLWLSIVSRPWNTLAIVPGCEGAALDFTLTVAVTLARTGMVHLGSPIQVADATRVPLNQLTPFLEEVRRCTSGGDRLLVALPPTSNSPICAAIAQATDAAILCVILGKMTSAQTQNTLKVVGAQRFLGSAIFHPHEAGH